MRWTLRSSRRLRQVCWICGGVSNVDTNDALIRQALKLYCKANVGYGDEEGKFAKAYEYLKKSLALNSDYQKPGS